MSRMSSSYLTTFAYKVETETRMSTSDLSNEGIFNITWTEVWKSRSTAGLQILHQSLKIRILQFRCKFSIIFQTSFFTEIREIVRSDDLSQFDCLIYQKGNLLDKLLRTSGRLKDVGSFDEEDQVTLEACFYLSIQTKSFFKHMHWIILIWIIQKYPCLFLFLLVIDLENYFFSIIFKEEDLEWILQNNHDEEREYLCDLSPNEVV